jgi:translation initiation factor IF-2
MVVKSKVKSRNNSSFETEDEVMGGGNKQNGKGKGGGRPFNNRGSNRPEKSARVEPKVIDAVVVEDSITVRDLAKLMERSPIDLIKVLMQYGIMAPITHSIDHDTAVILGEELGIDVKWPAAEEPEEDEDDEAPVSSTAAQSLVRRVREAEKQESLVERPPVIAVLGHVDHGKTTLLDRIRHTNVAAGEAGGITQATGAYQVTIDGRKITFLDTPGHEAFTAMRARGAQVTDIVVLVVAADDGVMPQTREAINHARAAGVNIIVAMNKIDKANANPQRVMEELAKEGLQAEQWGGDTIVVEMSALTNLGIEDLLENILLVAEVEGYKANPNGKCVGTVIEAELDKFRGVTATLLVQNGTLRRGDAIVVGNTWGRIKAMFNSEGQPIQEAGPSDPVVILGLQEVPNAGETFEVMSSDREAKQIAEERQDERSRAAQSPVNRNMTLEEVFARFEKGETKNLNLIVRADVQGSLEPVLKSLEDLGNEEIGIKILQAAIGDISESDVMLAEASDAVIIGFNVGADKAAAQRAEQSGVEIRHYNVIYKMIEDIEAALKGMLEPVYEEVKIGEAQVLQLFKLRRGVIAGCSVTSGVIRRNALAKGKRDGQDLTPMTRIETLRRFSEDTNEVRTGFECGIKLADGDELLQEGDTIEVYERQRVR